MATERLSLRIDAVRAAVAEASRSDWRATGFSYAHKHDSGAAASLSPNGTVSMLS